MAQRLVRASAYLPAFTDGVGRVAAPDEDPFTIAATALERAVGRTIAGGGTQTVHWVGPAPPPDAAELSSVLGSPVRLLPEDGSRAGLDRALREAAAADRPEWVVAAQRGDGNLGPPGDGGVALLFGPGPGAGELPRWREARSGADEAPGALAQLFSLAVPGPGSDLWVGDWHAEPARGLALPPGPRASRGPPPYTVSQGAFVAGPRDEESRPSRWRFVADRCGACRVITFPARGRCRDCGRSDGLGPEALPLEGWTVVALTWIGAGGQPTEFDSQVEATGPYGVVLAEIGPDVRVTLPVADASREELRVGSKVDTRLRRLYPIEGAWRYGRKAVPARG